MVDAFFHFLVALNFCDAVLIEYVALLAHHSDGPEMLDIFAVLDIADCSISLDVRNFSLVEGTVPELIEA